jgi:hypothetical protein
MGAAPFDPICKRDLLLGDCGYEWSLSKSYGYAWAKNALGAVANSNLSTAIECLLVGFDEPAERLLKRAAEWSQEAIVAHEKPDRYFPHGTEAANFYTLALSSWLLCNKHNSDAYRQFVEHENRYLLNSKAGKNRAEVSFNLPKYVDAAAFEPALEIFARTPRLRPPQSLVLRGEAAISYVLCRYQPGLQYNREEVDRTTTRFLRANVDTWLGDGGWTGTATWMKIFYWNMTSPRPSARDALLKCYVYITACRPTVF